MDWKFGDGRTMRLPRNLLDLERIDEVNLAGRGGRERDVVILLSNWTRVNAPLHDFEIENRGERFRVEVKKQANLQWFDSGKYHQLNRQDRDIRILFLIHEKGRIDIVAVACLGEFIDWLFENRKSDGWNEEVLRVGDDFKRRFPSLQFKARAHVATILKDAPELFDVLYRRGD